VVSKEELFREYQELCRSTGEQPKEKTIFSKLVFTTFKSARSCRLGPLGNQVPYFCGIERRDHPTDKIGPAYTVRRKPGAMGKRRRRAKTAASFQNEDGSLLRGPKNQIEEDEEDEEDSKKERERSNRNRKRKRKKEKSDEEFLPPKEKREMKRHRRQEFNSVGGGGKGLQEGGEEEPLAVFSREHIIEEEEEEEEEVLPTKSKRQQKPKAEEEQDEREREEQKLNNNKTEILQKESLAEERVSQSADKGAKKQKQIDKERDVEEVEESSVKIHRNMGDGQGRPWPGRGNTGMYTRVLWLAEGIVWLPLHD